MGSGSWFVVGLEVSAARYGAGNEACLWTPRHARTLRG
jgi:hypothetical protein